MELFDEGGLMQEGGTVDPVSGNDVPVGSTQEEVRDDIPAQLSEGEFVMPADVVRYHGLDKMMALRDEAKMGLQRMDDMGQMGNSEEAIIPDGVPFDMDDLEMEDDGLEMNVGGLVGSPVTIAASNALGRNAPAGTLGPPIQASPQVVVYGPDGTAYPNPAAAIAAGVNNYTMTKPTTRQTTPPPAAPKAAAPMQAASAQFQQLGGTKFTPTTQTTTTTPTFQETIGMGVPYVDYDPNAPDGTEQPETPAAVTPPMVQPSDGDGGGDGGDDDSGVTGTISVGSISELLDNFKGLIGGGDADAPRGKSVGDIFVSAANKNNYYGGSKDFGFGNETLRKATAVQGASQLGSLGLTGIVTELTKAAGLTNFTIKDVGTAGFTGMNQALNSMGLTNRGQLMNDRQATLVGKAMAAGHTAAYKGQDVQAAINGVLGTQEAIDIQDRAYDAIKNAYVEKAGAKGTFTDKDFADEMARVERSAIEAERVGFNRQTPRDSRPGQEADAEFRSNVVTDRFGNPVTSGTGKNKTNVLTSAGKTKKDRLNAIANQARVNREQAEKKAAARQQAERDRYRSEFNDSQNDGGPPPGATPVSMTTSDIGAMSPEDVAGMFDGQSDNEGGSYDSDPGNFGASDSFAKGGLAQQMKRSGLASKK